MQVFNIYSWVILPFIVFLAGIADVTLGTLRGIFVYRRKRNIALLLSFVEAVIWIVMVGQIIINVYSIIAYFGYAFSFAAGTYVGMKIDARLDSKNLYTSVLT